MKATLLSIIVAALFIGGAWFLTRGTPAIQATAPTAADTADNVTVVDGKQIITIDAKGGYLPVKSTAKAGMPTVIRFDTNGTFDCSASVRIPSMDITEILPQTGTTDVDIGVQQVATLQGTCGMGMYPFEVEFKS